MSLVYIIDDDVSVVEILSSVLKNEGFEIASSTNPDQFSCNMNPLNLQLSYQIFFSIIIRSQVKK